VSKAGDAIGAAVVDDGLRDGGDVVVVERGVEGAAAVAGGSEGDALGGNGGVGVQGVKGGEQARGVEEILREGVLAGGICGHVPSLGGEILRQVGV
jgi:hypothetical protein